MRRPRLLLPASLSACALSGCLFVAAMSLPLGAALQAQMSCKDMGRMSKSAPAKSASTPSTSLTISIGGKPTTFSVADLNAMPQKTVKVHNEHTKADESYTGVALADLLAGAGFAVSQTTHQAMLRSYLKVEGTDHYWVLYSLTEVEPSEHDGDVLVATSVDGKPLGADGALKLVSSGDRKPQRWVRNLTAITLKPAE